MSYRRKIVTLLLLIVIMTTLFAPTVLACCSKKLYYYPNGGTGAPPTQKTPYKTYATISSTIPWRTNHTFLGWSEKCTAGVPQYQPGDSIYMNKTRRLYAVWGKSAPQQVPVTVTHMAQLTGEILKEEQFLVNPGKYGPYAAQTFAGYEPGKLAPGSAAASGTTQAGQTKAIVYLYAKTPMAIINVVHKDIATGEILLSETHEIKAGKYGTYKAQTFPDYEAGKLAAGSAAVSGAVKEGEIITVTFVYAKSPMATIVVVHKDSATGEILLQETHGIKAGKYGTYKAQTFPDYEPGKLAAGSAAVSGTVKEGETKTIVFQYAKSPTGTVNVVHMDSVSKKILLLETFTVAVGKYGLYSAQTFDLYEAGKLAAGSAAASGTIKANEVKTITYLYAKVPTGTINITHQELSQTGLVLFSEQHEVKAGAYGTYGPKAFDGYNAGVIAPGSAAPFGTIKANETLTITFHYAKLPTDVAVTVKHYDADTQELLGSNDYTVVPGAYGPYYPSSFAGYQAGVSAPGSAPVFDVVAAGDTVSIVFLYTKIVVPQTATVNVQHLNTATGMTILEDTFIVEPGPYGPYLAKNYADFEAGALAPQSAPASGTVAVDETLVITYLYEPLQPLTASIIVVHKDHATGEKLLTDNVQVVLLGSYGPLTPSIISGYGPGTLAVDSDPAAGSIGAGETRTIIFEYVQDPVVIEVGTYTAPVAVQAVLSFPELPEPELSTFESELETDDVLETVDVDE